MTEILIAALRPGFLFCASRLIGIDERREMIDN